MSLSVVGAGLGRTGTLSLKMALEQLELGRCFHMVELMENPDLLPHWDRAGRGESVDWDEVFEGYGATVDWPSCSFYEQLAEHYPYAKVILTTRNADKWFDSTQATIFKGIEKRVDPANPFGSMIQNVVINMFDGIMHARDHCIAVYERHNAEVRRVIPSNRLLEFNVSEGWEPLCKFLNLQVPGTPFPRVNSTDEFQARFQAQESGANS
jgi:hypothetical protein